MGQLGADGGDRKAIPPYKDHREPEMTNTDDDRIKFIQRISGIHSIEILNELIFAYEQGKNGSEPYREILQKIRDREVWNAKRIKMQSRAEQILKRIILEIIEGLEFENVYLIEGERMPLIRYNSERLGGIIGITDIEIIKIQLDGDVEQTDFSIRLENGFFRHIRNPLILKCCGEFTYGNWLIPLSEISFTIDDFTEEELDKVDKTKLEYDKAIMWCKTTGKWGDDREYFYETLRNWQFANED